MNNYTEEVKQILKRSELIGIKENNEYVTTKHIVLAIKEMKTSIDNILNKYIQKNETNEENYKIERNSYILYSKELLKTIEEIIYQTNELSNIISLPILLNTLLTNKDTEAYKYLKKTKVDINSLKKEVETIGLIKENILLNSIGTNLNEISSSLDPVIGRDKEILEIIERSEKRVEPDCSTYKRCGGCNLRHIDYEETLNIKQQKVQNLINKTLTKKVEVWKQ